MSNSEENNVFITGEVEDAKQPEQIFIEKKDSGEHHHHRHHSSSLKHHYKRRRSKRSKICRFYKKNAKLVKIIAFLLAVTLVSLIAVYTDRSITYSQNGSTSSGSNKTSFEGMQENMLYAGVPVFKDEVPVISNIVKSYIDSDITVNISAFVKGIKSTKRQDIGQAVELKFDVFSFENKNAVKTSKLEIADNESFKNPWYYDLNDDFNVSVWNLKADTKYNYRLYLILESGKELVYTGSFETAKTARLINVDGIGNVRDIGGWNTVSGKTVKQGLLFRGTELDGAVETSYKLSEKGIKEMKDRLGIKFDMDLREPTDFVPGEYILGKDVTHKYYSASMYGGIFENAGKKSLRKVFADLANEKNYPMYVHCTYGRDRTGTVCYLLEALLGVSENDLIKEYELSGFFHNGINRSDIMTVYGGLLSYEGANIQQKTENYLLSIGVTTQEIANIKRIFLQ